MPARISPVIAFCSFIITLAATGALPAEPLTGKVMTVSGPVSPEVLGMTLTHEHLIIDYKPAVDTPEGWRTTGDEKPSTPADIAFYEAPLTMDKLGAAYMGKPNRDDRRLSDETLAIREVTDYKWSGGGSIVEVTSNGIGRNPAALKRISEATGVHVIMGSGWYEHGFNGNALDDRSVESLAGEIVRDITVGVGDTGIRAGIIGEIGVKQASKPYERKIIAAAARASQISGAAISIHMAKGYHEQLATMQLLKEAGADLRRVAMGHSNPIADNMPLMKRVLDQGAFLQFDLLGDPPQILSEVPDHDVALAIVELLKHGYGDRILLSQDVFLKPDLKAYGGSGYSFIAEHFAPYLRQMGVTDTQIRQMLVDNPRRLLTFVAPRAAR